MEAGVAPNLAVVGVGNGAKDLIVVIDHAAIYGFCQGFAMAGLEFNIPFDSGKNAQNATEDLISRYKFDSADA